MSIGEGLGQGLMFLANQVAANKRSKKENEQALQMFKLKQAAELDQLQKMETFKDDLATKRRDKALSLLRAKYGGGDVPQVAPVPQSQPAPAIMLGQEQVPANAPTQQTPTFPLFNSKGWQQQHYEDYIDNETGAFDEKGFRKGLDDAQKENATLQYLRANGLENLPDNVNLGSVTPFVGEMIKSKNDQKKLDQNKTYVKEYANRNGLKLTDQELEAYASQPGTVERIVDNNLQKQRFDASEKHADARERNASKRLEIALSKVGGGGRSGSSGGGGWKQTRMGGYVKVDRHGNPTGQAITAAEAYNIGITNTPPPTRKPRGMSGGAKAPIPVPKISL